MKNKKIYARQVPPEYQESPLMWGEIETDYINITGNRHFQEHVSLLFENARGALENGDILGEWDAINIGESAYDTWAEVLRDIIPPSGRGEYTRAERLKIAQIASDYYYGADENNSICELLSIITGKLWAWRTLRGCCQSDWVEAFYPVHSWSREYIKNFETEYFNTGSEWIIHDGDDAPGDPDEINGYSIYCHSYDPREEIAKEHGAKPEDVVLYEFSGFTRVARWEAV